MYYHVFSKFTKFTNTSNIKKQIKHYLHVKYMYAKKNPLHYSSSFTFVKSIWNPGIPPTIIPVCELNAGMTAKLGMTQKSPAPSNRNFK